MTSAEKLITDNIDVWTSAIKQKSASGRGSSSKQELYGIKKLRELILELAVRGLLIPQDQNDEPADTIVEQFILNKQRLIKEKKLKKTKKLRLIESDEITFKLPDAWCLERLGNISHLITKGTTPTSLGYSYSESGIQFVKIENIDKGRINSAGITQFIDKETNEALSRSQLESGDVLFSIAGTIGKTCIVFEDDLPANTNQALAIIRGTSSVFISKYLRLQLDSFVAEKTRQRARGGAMPNVSLGDLTELVLCVPPLEEQKRIVAKVDELMALCDQLEAEQENSLSAHQTLVETLLAALVNAADNNSLTAKDGGNEEIAGANFFQEAWARIANHFDILFTTEQSIEQLKQTILQLAVMGKLVPQDPNDEPASVLLEKIAAEKAHLIKDKKIKRQKALAPIDDSELLYDIPDSWAWSRLGETGIGSTGKTPSTKASENFDGDIPFIGPGQITPNGKILDADKFLTVKGLESSVEAIDGDILMVCIGGSIGKAAISQKQIAFNQQINSVRPLYIKTEYLYLAVCSPTFYEALLQKATGSATPIINRGKWEELLVAIPPLEEQKRIVAKVDELMALCDQIKTQINTAQTTQLQLADALAAQALN